MNPSLPPVKGQEKRYFAIIVLGMLLLLFANAITWIYLQRIRNVYEDDLRFRMQNLAKIAARQIDAMEIQTLLPGDENDPSVIYYQQLLYEIKESNRLQDIYVVSLTGDLFIDVKSDFVIGSRKGSFSARMISQVAGGKTVSTPLQSLGDQKFLSALAPCLMMRAEPLRFW